jgi:hypothetical protein
MRRALKSSQLRQQEELPQLQSGFAGSSKVVTSTTKMAAQGGRDINCHLAFNMNKQDLPLNLITSRQHLCLMTGNLNESFG